MELEGKALKKGVIGQIFQIIESTYLPLVAQDTGLSGLEPADPNVAVILGTSKQCLMGRLHGDTLQAATERI